MELFNTTYTYMTFFPTQITSHKNCSKVIFILKSLEDVFISFSGIWVLLCGTDKTLTA